jgi:hypothetical protein
MLRSGLVAMCCGAIYLAWGGSFVSFFVQFVVRGELEVLVRFWGFLANWGM